MANIGSMDDIQNSCKETIAEFEDLGYSSTPITTKMYTIGATVTAAKNL